MDDYVKKQLTIVSFLYFGDLSIGYFSGWTAPAVAKLQHQEQTPLDEPLTNSKASLMASVAFLGVIIGAQLSGFVSNQSGRKPCLLLGGIIIMGSYILLAFAADYWMLLASRLFVGLGGGIVFIVNLAYIAEISSTDVRGIFMTGTGIATAAGNFFSYCVGPYVSFRAMSFVGIVLAMVFTAGALFVPESPVFYVLKGKEFEAKTILVRLGRSMHVEDVLSSTRTTSSKQEWRSIISVKSNRKAMVIATVLLVSQQTAGCCVVMLFGTTIFQSVSSSISPALATIIIGGTQLAASCITPFFVERVGRKVLMLSTTAACFLSQVAVGTYFCLESLNPDLASKVHWMPLISLMAFLLFYTIGYGIIPGTWMSEMFDSSARGPGCATAMTISWIVGFIVIALFGHMTELLGRHITFYIYSLSCAFAFVFTALVVPETKGKSLTEIQMMLNK